ncbi:MAG: hypothetical protein Q8L85_02230 [Alphaproteobacteria bacterium]|nr:hypothetical protein [Alphaproteobacteria bacterium]
MSVYNFIKMSLRIFLNLNMFFLLLFCMFLIQSGTDLYANPEDDLANGLIQDAKDDAEKIYQLGVKFRIKDILQEYPLLNKISEESLLHYGLKCFQLPGIDCTANSQYNMACIYYELLHINIERNFDVNKMKELLLKIICYFRNATKEYGVDNLDQAISKLKTIFLECEEEIYASFIPKKEDRIIFFLENLINDEVAHPFGGKKLFFEEIVRKISVNDDLFRVCVIDFFDESWPENRENIFYDLAKRIHDFIL